MKPAAFLFDLDGTLMDTERAWTVAIVDWLADRGQKAAYDDVLKLVYGRSWPDIAAALHAAYPGLGNSSPTEDAKTLRPYNRALTENPESQVIPGAVAFLRKVAKFAPCVIVSGSPHADVVKAASTCGVSGLVRFVLGAEDYARGKPAPDGFLKAATMLDVDASECVVVEDSTAGVAAGRAAGMHIIGVDRQSSCQQDFSGCDWLVHDLSELDVKVEFGEDVGLKDQAKRHARTLIDRIVLRGPK
ncbi:MAG: HAD family phosphatase [Kiritimatiellae bacterium]|nr:HAD family phosphatase [Kiritimatiellia bacterium]